LVILIKDDGIGESIEFLTKEEREDIGPGHGDVYPTDIRPAPQILHEPQGFLEGSFEVSRSKFYSFFLPPRKKVGRLEVATGIECLSYVAFEEAATNCVKHDENVISIVNLSIDAPFRLEKGTWLARGLASLRTQEGHRTRLR